MDDPRIPRLLVLASTYPRWRGDPEPGFVHELCKRLTDRFKVTALVPDAPGADPDGDLDGVNVVRYRYAPRRLQLLVNDGGIVTNLHRAPWKWLLVPGFVLASAWHTWRLLVAQRHDVVHAHWLLPQGLIVAVLGSLDRRIPPFVVTSHGADLFALRAAPLQVLKRFVAKRAAGITVVSPAMRDELTRIGVEETKITVQPMGVDLSTRFTPNGDVQRSDSEILFVGRLVEKKGLRYLIEAMTQILAQRPDASLTVAGFGPEESACRAQAASLGLGDKVSFVGAIKQAELPALYRRAAVFVAPFVEAASGDREGLGLVAVEAAGCGCPVVVSDLPAVRHVFPDAGMARRVKPADPAALAEAILQVLAQPHSLPNDYIEPLRAKFDWGTVSDGYAERLVECARMERPAWTTNA